MGVDLGGAQVFVAQDLLEDPDVHPAVLVHQGGGGVPQLVGGKAPPGKAGGSQGLLHDLFHPPGGQGPLVFGKEEVLPVLFHLRFLPHPQVDLQGADAGFVEVDHPLFVALAQEDQGAVIPMDAAFLDSHQLGKPHPAVEQQGDDAVVPLLPGAGAVHRLEQLNAFLQGEVFGEGFPLAWGLQVLHGADLQKPGLAGKVLVKGPQAGNLPGAGGGVVLVGRLDKVQVAVGVGKGGAQDHLTGHILDGDMGKVWLRHGQAFPGCPEVPEEQPQVDKVGIDGPLGPALDGEHIKKEVFEELGALGFVDVHGMAWVDPGKGQ